MRRFFTCPPLADLSFVKEDFFYKPGQRIKRKPNKQSFFSPFVVKSVRIGRYKNAINDKIYNESEYY